LKESVGVQMLPLTLLVMCIILEVRHWEDVKTGTEIALNGKSGIMQTPVIILMATHLRMMKLERLHGGSPRLVMIRPMLGENTMVRDIANK
jgi:hypothetical protein